MGKSHSSCSRVCPVTAALSLTPTPPTIARKSFLLPVLGWEAGVSIHPEGVWRNLFHMPGDLVLVRDSKETCENKRPIHRLGK